MGINENIRRLREEHGFSQLELAERLGVSRTTVTQWENSTSSPRMGMATKIANVFRVNLSDLVADNAQYDNDIKRLSAVLHGINDEGRAALMAYAEFVAERYPS